jgi:hypothetical protein
MGLTGSYIWPYYKYKDYESGYIDIDIWLGRQPTSGAQMELEDTIEGLALGRKSWQLFNDSCSKNYSQTFNLTFSACKEIDFVCMDGSCLIYDKRCDSIPDCPDGSDEQGRFQESRKLY